jgi:hypothetical protein
MGVGKRILDHKEGENKQQLQNLNGWQLAVVMLLYTNVGSAKMKMRYGVHDAVDCLVSCIFIE